MTVPVHLAELHDGAMKAVVRALGGEFEAEYQRGRELQPENYASGGAATQGAISTALPQTDAAG